jgi:hypothetical protein
MCQSQTTLTAISSNRDIALNVACADRGSFSCGNAIRVAQDDGNMVIFDSHGLVHTYPNTTPTVGDSPLAKQINEAIVMPVVGAAVIGTAAVGGSGWLAGQVGKLPKVQFDAVELIKGATLSATASAGIYSLTRLENSTPAGVTTAFAAGAIGGGIVKQGLNYAAGLANTAIPLTLSNAVTQVTGLAYGFGTLGWLNAAQVTSSGNSWWTTPIFNKTPSDQPVGSK